MIILGIETSCDETGVAICSDFKILSSFTKTQSIYKLYGGVVPEIASSEHEKNHITKKLSNKMRNIYVVPDFTPKPLQSLNDKFKPKEKGSLRLLFLSRISPMKNLDFLLKVLAKVEILVELSIYVPKED